MVPDDDTVLADMATLEFYLDRSVRLRLQNYPPETEAQRQALQQASRHAIIVHRTCVGGVVRG